MRRGRNLVILLLLHYAPPNFHLATSEVPFSMPFEFTFSGVFIYDGGPEVCVHMYYVQIVSVVDGNGRAACNKSS